MQENENQRFGRDKETTVNHNYINSGEYKRKFDTISNSKELSRLLYKLAKNMLLHRSGSKYEDMYWIDLDTLEIIAKETNATWEKRIDYTRKTKKAIRKHHNILTIHTHPDSFPPSINDFNSNYEHGYEIGIIACHNGKVYMYSANERINTRYYKLVVEGYLKRGYNEDEAQLLALTEIQRNFDIRFKEVTDNGSI